MPFMIAIVACAIHPSFVLEAASRANGVTVTMRLMKPSFVHGEPIGVEITIANTSDKDVEIWATSLPFGYKDYECMLGFDVRKTKIELLEPPHMSIRPGGNTLKK